MFTKLVKFEERVIAAWKVLTGQVGIGTDSLVCKKNHFDKTANVLLPIQEHKNLKAASLALEIASGVILGVSTKENNLYTNYTQVVAKATNEMRK